MSSAVRSSAVGAFPDTMTTFPPRAAARSMLTAARVQPRSAASAATSGSAMKQRQLMPSFAADCLRIPDRAMLVSVTITVPGVRISRIRPVTPGEKYSVSA